MSQKDIHSQYSKFVLSAKLSMMELQSVSPQVQCCPTSQNCSAIFNPVRKQATVHIETAPDFLAKTR